jgi:diguanylate cyclase (GGDEF)-like protein
MSSETGEPIVLADMMLRQATKRDQVLAALFLLVFVGITLASARFDRVPATFIGPFIPICATLWGAADLLTAFLLLTQFSVNGIRAFAYLGSAYTFSGILTIPYIVFFPGLFFAGPQAAGTQQVSAYLWLDWHLVFPLVIAGYRIYDPNFSRRFLSGEHIRAGLRNGLSILVAGAALTTAVIVLFGDRLPPLFENGHFTWVYRDAFAPLAVALNGGAAIMIIGTSRKASLLQVWLGVALATSALDAFLNAWTIGRFTVSWYVGKVETLTTASVVMLMLLTEVGALYRRLGTMAILDPLTGLRNRRSFDEYMIWTLGHRRRPELALLLLDVDYFKQYNDRYGHAAGDVCLRHIADVLRESLWRSVDLVARYGGEEFVVLLPDTTASGAVEVAERIRNRVAHLTIPHAASAVSPFVTVSIGVAHATPSNPADGANLFARADGALYAAKVRRNATVLAESIGSAPLVAEELQLLTHD